MSEIYLVSGTGELLPHFMQIRNGYPELLTVPPPSYTFTHRYLRIDRYPATFVTATSPNMADHTVGLLVHVPEASLFYFFTGIADARHADRLNHEMQQIVASFHIEKAAGLPAFSH